VTPLRILHTPENTAGNPEGLAQAERAIGLDSHVAALHPPAYGYPTDEVIWPDDPSLPVRELRRYRLLARALRLFDVVHFNFGLSITPPWVPPGAEPPDEPSPRLRRIYRNYSRAVEQRELPLLRRAGRGIVVTFQGDDARQGDRLGRFAINPLSELAPGYYTPAGDAHKRTRIARWARYADQIYALNPDLLHVLPAGARFVPYASVDPQAWTPVPPHNDVPLVVHAPTHQGIKGTRFVLDAVERLRAQGVRLDFQLVEGLTRDEARRLYERADVVVDQLLLGWYGGLAVEAMALGKPVVCYIRDEDLAFIPPEMAGQIPVVRADPGTIEGVLHQLVSAPRTERVSLGERGRAYVERWHDPQRIAESLRPDYEASARR
jgi:glycosyltransferase involved in cell wall biosynthesis